MAAKRLVPLTKFGRAMFNMRHFNQVGLLSDDMLQETPDVKEAIRRLPKDVQDERNFRLAVAIDLSCAKSVLPKEQWTTPEKDDPYLQPYLIQVWKENKEREEWNSQ